MFWIYGFLLLLLQQGVFATAIQAAIVGSDALQSVSRITGTKTIDAILNTAAPVASRRYSLEFGPRDGYVFATSKTNEVILQHGATYEERVALCAELCDQTPGCISFAAILQPACYTRKNTTLCVTSTARFQPGNEHFVGRDRKGCYHNSEATIFNLQ